MKNYFVAILYFILIKLSAQQNTISGYIKREDGSPVENVTVFIRENGNGTSDTIKTNLNGFYEIKDLPFPNTYSIRPNKDYDPLNGVTAADIVVITKHILGLVPIESPYALLAGDVNSSLSLSSADIATIRKLILGLVSKFDLSTSWIFIPKSFIFDPINPTTVPNEILITDQNASQSHDFIAVKKGDVNLSASTR